MRTNLQLIKEGKALLEQLQKQELPKITAEQKEAMDIYGGLLNLKLYMYYTSTDGDSEDIMNLKEKYNYLDLSNIDEAMRKALKNVNEKFRLRRYKNNSFFSINGDHLSVGDS